MILWYHTMEIVDIVVHIIQKEDELESVEVGNLVRYMMAS